MAYTPTTWLNDSAPYLDSTNLNKMEQGIVLAHTLAETEAWNTWQNLDDTDTGTELSSWDRVFADTTSAAFSLDLPAAPSVGDKVFISDVAGTFDVRNLTVVGNGNNVVGGAELILDQVNTGIEFTYSGSTYGWVITIKA